MTDGNFIYLTRKRIVEIEKELLEMKTNCRKNIISFLLLFGLLIFYFN
jgi:hypothetical protein